MHRPPTLAARRRRHPAGPCLALVALGWLAGCAGHGAREAALASRQAVLRPGPGDGRPVAMLREPDQPQPVIRTAAVAGAADPASASAAPP